MTLRKLSTIGLTLTWVFAYTATHIPAERVPDLHASDKTMHAVGYFVLAAGFLLTLRLYRKPLATRVIWCGVIFACYALFDELTQELVGRSFEWLDIAADLAGAAAAISLDAIITAIAPRKSR